jgi:hypothetical protein
VDKADLVEEIDGTYETMAESPPKMIDKGSRKIKKNKRKGEGKGGCKNKKKKK